MDAATAISFLAPIWLEGQKQSASIGQTTATIEIEERITGTLATVSKFFDVRVFDPALAEQDLGGADAWLRARYAPQARPWAMVALLMLNDFVCWGDDEGAVPAVPSLGNLASMLGVPLEVVRQMSAVEYAEGTMHRACEVGRIAGLSHWIGS